MDPKARNCPYFEPLPSVVPPPGPSQDDPLQSLLHHPIPGPRRELQAGVGHDGYDAEAWAPSTAFSEYPPKYGFDLKLASDQPSRNENYANSQLIFKQPTVQRHAPGSSMSMLQTQTDVRPPGLEYLTTIDQLLVHQKVQIFEALTGCETQNKFHVRNNLGQDVFYAAEDSNCFARNCCGPLRPFAMEIFDNAKNEVVRLYRPLAYQDCCFPGCLQTMDVLASPGICIGSIRQEWSIIRPIFAVRNANGQTILRIRGPFFKASWCCNDVNYRITTPDGGEDVGRITKQWSGLLKEVFTDADNFSITFPVDLDVNMKVVLLGAAFLIDAMFYEGVVQRIRNMLC